MDINNLKTEKLKCLEQKRKIAAEIANKQSWIDYFTIKKERSQRNCKNLLIHSVAYLIIAMCSVLLPQNYFIGAGFMGLSLGCCIVAGYQRFVVYRKFNKVIKATQKNLDICKENNEKLTELSSEIDKQIKKMKNISEKSFNEGLSANQEKIEDNTNSNTHTL